MKRHLRFGLPLDWPAELKIAAMLLIPLLGLFFKFSRSKQIGVSVHCIALKKLVNVEVRKLEFFALKCPFKVKIGYKHPLGCGLH